MQLMKRVGSVDTARITHTSARVERYKTHMLSAPWMISDMLASGECRPDRTAEDRKLPRASVLLRSAEAVGRGWP